MDKKPLIGVCILAVVLLILASLTNVVGYQSVKSHTICDSPLFDIRTNSATNNENVRVLTSDYLGKGINAFSFPQRDSRTEMIQKFIDGIRAMDDETYNRFIKYAVNQIAYKDNFKDNDIIEFTRQLYQFRENTQKLEVYTHNLDDQKTYRYNFVRTLCWLPGCFIYFIIDYVFILIVGMLIMIYLTVSYPKDCNPPTSMSVCCH
ncbi:MAG: hypothetical protein WC525_01400 [Candidatus Thermoplasmatota archaeon]